MDSAILVYTISSDELRSEFVESLTKRGWLLNQDQSTLVLPHNTLIFSPKIFSDWFDAWSRGKNWQKEDFIQVYYPKIILQNKISTPALDSIYFHTK